MNYFHYLLLILLSLNYFNTLFSKALFVNFGSQTNEIQMVRGYAYILSNKNLKVLYIGVTKNLKERIDVHKSGKGAIFTKKYNATILLYFEEFDDFHDAFTREKNLKNWRSEWKWNLIKTSNPELKDLYLEL